MSTPVGQSYWDQPLLTHTLVRGTRVNISKQTIHRFLFGADRPLPATIVEFDHPMETVKNWIKMWDADQKLELLRWIAGYIEEDGVEASWVTGKLDIKKSTLYFVGRFWWSVVRHWLGPTNADNSLTLDRAVVVDSIIVGYDIHITRYILREIHKCAFRDHTSIPFPCLIQSLCDKAGVVKLPTIDHYIEVTHIANIGLMQ